jgi:protease-4
VTGIAEGRGLDAAGLRTVIDRGPFTASEALAAGLVDGLRYRDELREEVSSRLEAQVSERPRAQDEPLWMRAEDWYDALPSERVPNSNGPVIAWIQGNGAIAAGGGGIDPLSGERTLGADSLGAALRAAARDDEVEAILLRVESPGGSYVASDAIWRETIRAREAGKPLVVSMGNVAGSGGYYIAMDADWIVARPGSITGSIGVLAGKIVTRELFEEKLGITFDRLQSSKNGSMFSQQRAYTEEEEARNASWLDQAYADFTQKVAEGRDLPPAQVQAIARGRIWSGEDALRLGLVDELGGLPEALAKARELAGIEADAPVELRSYPRERGLIATLLGDDSSDVEAMSGPASGGRTGRASLIKAARTSFASPASDPSVSALLETLRPIHEIGRELGLLGESTGALWTPDWPVVP